MKSLREILTQNQQRLDEMHDDDNPHVKGLKNYVEQLSKSFSVGPHNIIHKHGRSYKFDASSFQGGKAAQKQCFQNAGRHALAHPDRTYVEGYVSVHGIPIEHAWTVDKSGKVHDPTLKDGKGVGGYFGVPFKDKYLAAKTNKKKTWGLLDHTNRAIESEDPDTFLEK